MLGCCRYYLKCQCVKSLSTLIFFHIPRTSVINVIFNSSFLDGTDSAALLGTLDSAFLFSYGAAMFVSGFVAVS